MEIPYQELSADTIKGIVEQYVLGEGTDYGDCDFSLEEKVAGVLAQLKSGKVKIIFDATEEVCTIVPTWKIG